MFSFEKCLRLTSLGRCFIASTKMGRGSESKELEKLMAKVTLCEHVTGDHDLKSSPSSGSSTFQRCFFFLSLSLTPFLGRRESVKSEGNLGISIDCFSNRTDVRGLKNARSFSRQGNTIVSHVSRTSRHSSVSLPFIGHVCPTPTKSLHVI